MQFEEYIKQNEQDIITRVADMDYQYDPDTLFEKLVKEAKAEGIEIKDADSVDYIAALTELIHG